MRRRALLAGLLLGGLVVSGMALSGCGSQQDAGVVSGVTTSDHDGYAGVLLPKPYAVPDRSLSDTAGKPFSLTKDTSGRLSIVFFGYTHCPDICQVVMSTIASAYARLDNAQQREVQVLFVTTDPARDTGPVLRRYLDRLNPAFVGLTGSIDQIDAVAEPFGIFIKKGQKLASGGYEVDHSTTIVAIGRHETAPLVWSATISPSELATDVKKLLEKRV